jgi:endonuclease-3
MDTYTAAKVIDAILDHFGQKAYEGVGYDGSTPYHILVSTILSQQTTERNSRKASEQLFSECSCPMDIYKMDQEKLEELIFSSGYYRQKARNIKAVTKIIVEDYGGEVPDDLNELMDLPSVGKKTAACVMRYGFGRPSVIVDTHINRVSQRLGISDSKKPEDTQKALTETVPQDRWDDMDFAFITLGRTYCRPSSPDCGGCPVSRYCRLYQNSECQN